MAFAYNSYKFVTVSLLKWLLNGRFASETAARGFGSEMAIWIQKWFKKSV
jgi:hypothetical protein